MKKDFFSNEEKNLIISLSDIFSFYKNVKDNLANSNNISDLSIRVMAIDYGTKKIGIAITDRDCSIAFNYKTIVGNWKDKKNVVNQLEKIIQEKSIKGIIFGFPKDLNGEFHKNCKIVFDIALYFNQSLPVLFFDERYTTKLANQKIKERNIVYKIKKNVLCDDEFSAMVLLEDFIRVVECKKYNINSTYKL